MMKVKEVDGHTLERRNEKWWMTVGPFTCFEFWTDEKQWTGHILQANGNGWKPFKLKRKFPSLHLIMHYAFVAWYDLEERQIRR